LEYFGNLEKLEIGIFCKSWKTGNWNIWDSWKIGKL